MYLQLLLLQGGFSTCLGPGPHSLTTVKDLKATIKTDMYSVAQKTSFPTMKSNKMLKRQSRQPLLKLLAGVQVGSSLHLKSVVILGTLSLRPIREALYNTVGGVHPERTAERC